MRRLVFNLRSCVFLALKPGRFSLNFTVEICVYSLIDPFKCVLGLFFSSLSSTDYWQLDGSEREWGLLINPHAQYQHIIDWSSAHCVLFPSNWDGLKANVTFWKLRQPSEHPSLLINALLMGKVIPLHKTLKIYFFL